MVGWVVMCRTAVEKKSGIFLRIYVRGLDKKFCPEINGYISGYISNGHWPDRSGGACVHAPKCACAHQKI
jgi:hypothetical protein